MNLGRFLKLLAIGSLALSRGATGGPLAASDPPFPLDPVIEQLTRRAASYEKAALGFSCDETVRVGSFSARSGESTKEDQTRYNYLYEGDPQSGFQEIRYLLDENGTPRETRLADPDLPIPGAYDWALLFTAKHKPYFRFEAGGEEIVGIHATRIVVFRGAAAWKGGGEVEEWSGRIWADRETGDFVKIEATPNRQDELLPLEMTKWQKGIRLGGVPLKKQPRGYRYELFFAVEKFGLTFPSEAVTRLFTVTPQGQEEIRKRITQTFSNYVFFNVHSDQEFLATPDPPEKKKPSP
jgi:hypothetical protein